MDMGKIYDDALRLWRSVSVGDMDGALQPGPGDDGNLLLLGENLGMMAALAEQVGGGARRPMNLVYMDPPYFSNRNPESRMRVKTPAGEALVRTPGFSDTWAKAADGTRVGGMEAYLSMLTVRLIAAHELLAEDGALWLHLDRRAVHYARVMADIVFGTGGCLVNEVIWSYRSGGSSTKRFANKHDTLLYYVKNRKNYKFFPQEEKSYNRALKPYRFKGVKEYRDDRGWYTMVNMRDVWEIPMVGRTAAERTGYATQKPEALLERIVLACTEEGDTCLDPFCGSGTLAAVCARRGRGWVCIDESPTAIEAAAKRVGKSF